MIKYHIFLSGQDRDDLEAILRQGRVRADKAKRARAILALDESQGKGAQSEEQAALLCQVSRRTVERWRGRFCLEGMASLEVRSRAPRTDRKVDGRVEAHLVALCCSEPPCGRSHWTLRLLSGRLVELKVVGSISHTTVGKVLKKTSLSPGAPSPGSLHR